MCFLTTTDTKFTTRIHDGAFIDNWNRIFSPNAIAAVCCHVAGECRGNAEVPH